MESKINWRRIEKAVSQQARAIGAESRVEETVSRLSQIVDICGDFSKNRRMLVRLGKIFLEQNSIIWVPYCPDYGQQNGCYTFQGMNGGIPLSVKTQIEFLKKVVTVMQNTKPLFLISDLDSDNEAILKAVRRTREEFELCVKNSLRAAREAVGTQGWEAELMTVKFPSWHSLEQKTIDWMRQNEKFKNRLETESVRGSRLILSREERLNRAERNASQLITLGGLASKENVAICDTTTGIMPWYLQTEAAILHNPFSLY